MGSLAAAVLKPLQVFKADLLKLNFLLVCSVCCKLGGKGDYVWALKEWRWIYRNLGSAHWAPDGPSTRWAAEIQKRCRPVSSLKFSFVLQLIVGVKERKYVPKKGILKIVKKGGSSLKEAGVTSKISRLFLKTANPCS